MFYQYSGKLMSCCLSLKNTLLCYCHAIFVWWSGRYLSLVFSSDSESDDNENSDKLGKEKGQGLGITES